MISWKYKKRLWWQNLFRLGCFLEAGGFLMMEVMFTLEVSIKYCQRCGLMWPAAMTSMMSRNQEEGVSRALRNIFGNTKKVSGFKIGSLNISSVGRPVVFRSVWFRLKVVKSQIQGTLTSKCAANFAAENTTWKARWPGSPSVMADMVAATLPQLSVEERQQVGVLTTILVFKGSQTFQTVCVNYILRYTSCIFI